MSESQGDVYSDEERYTNESFETDVPESSVYESDGEETSEMEKPKSASKELKAFTRNNEFWTCESSSDEDDVVLGHTIAEINTDPGDFDDDHLNLTPAARIFQLASQRKSAGKTIMNDNNDVDVDDDDDDEDVLDLDDCEENDDEIEELEEIENMSMQRENHIEQNSSRQFTKLKKQSEFVYEEEHHTLETSGIGMTEDYSDVGGVSEVNIGEPSLYQDIYDEENEESDEEMRNFIDNEEKSENTEHWEEESENEIEKENYEENECYSTVETSASGSDDDQDDDEKTIGPASTVAMSINEEVQSETKNDPKSETKSLHTDDSMEDFKRKVLLSDRMRCISDGGGDCATPKIRKSNIPIWKGNERLENIKDSLKFSHSKTCIRSMPPVPDVRTHGSLPDFSDAESLRQKQNHFDYDPNEEEGAFGFDDQFAGGDFDDYTSGNFKTDFETNRDVYSTGYSMQMEMFTDSNDIPKKPKKLKAGERRNKSFSNERLRDIERHNHILLHKILNQKPTYIIEERRKKKDKFAGLPPTTRITSAEVNRKKQQRQIDMDNQMLKRKLETIAKRKPNTKQK